MYYDNQALIVNLKALLVHAEVSNGRNPFASCVVKALSPTYQTTSHRIIKMGALYTIVHAIMWLVWLRALHLILTPLPDPPSPLLDLPPERLQLLADELSLSADKYNRYAGFLNILKQQMEKIDENLEIQRRLTQNIVNDNQNILVERQQVLVESQRIKRAMERLVATLKSRPSRVGKATADVKLPLDRPGTAAEDDFTALRLPRRSSF